MVHFGRMLQASQEPEWEEYYLQYKRMKKDINKLQKRTGAGDPEKEHEMVRHFAERLDFQVEKMVLFLIRRQGELAEDLLKLEQEQTELPKPADQTATEQRANDYRKVAEQLLHLLQFIELNMKGLGKIMKKFEKKTGVRVAEAYVTTRMKHRNSQLVQLIETVGVGALAGCITRNLADIHRKSAGSPRRRSFSLFRQKSLPEQLEGETVVQEIEAVRVRLRAAFPFQRFMAAGALIDMQTPMVGIPRTPSGTLLEEEKYDFAGVAINLIATFLYMVNYYIIVPSSDEYATLLGVPSTVSGLVIGAMPLGALISALVYSKWTNRSYYEPLIVSTVILIVGNLMYALALPLNSVTLILMGRAFCGLGGARAVNRRYIADHVPVKDRLRISAAFVSCSALGMAAGPALATVFDNLDIRVANVVVNYATVPGWLMTIAWALFLFPVVFLFKEPRRDPEHHKESKSKGDSGEDGVDSPLLKDTEEGRSSGAKHKEDKAKSTGPVSSLSEFLQELTPAVNVTLLVYFMLKLGSELVISETGLITKFYFHWKPRTVGLFMSLLAVTVLPVNTFVGSYVSNWVPDRKVLLWLHFLTIGGLLLMFDYPTLPYTPAQYIGGAMTVFVSTNTLEGVSLALLSRTMSQRLSSGTYNAGLLSTEAGTLARAAADVMITIVGRFGLEHILNLSLLPVLGVAVATMAYTVYHFDELKDALHED